MLLLSKKDIQRVFTMKDAIEADKKAFTLLIEGKCDAPLRTKIQAPKQSGVFLFMPAYVEEMETASLKMINIFPENMDKGLSTAPAQVLLIDGQTGYVKAILDGTYVTELRTGAASGVAFDILGRKDAKIGALIGTGSQAATQLEAMMATRDLEEIRVYDLDADRTKVFADRMSQVLKAYGTRIVPVESSDDAIYNADLIVTVTPSLKPVFDATKVKKGATLSCVGAYQHHMQEMDPVILKRASKIYFDSEEMVLSEAGDITIPLNDGTITKDDFTGDIGEVIKGQVIGRERDDEIIVFKTVGVATQDLVTAREIYDKALIAGVGTQWD